MSSPEMSTAGPAEAMPNINQSQVVVYIPVGKYPTSRPCKLAWVKANIGETLMRLVRHYRPAMVALDEVSNFQ